MVEKRKPMPVEDAVRTVMKQTLAAETEMLPLAEAHGRMLRKITADHDVPPFNKSPYDGLPCGPKIRQEPPETILSL